MKKWPAGNRVCCHDCGRPVTEAHLKGGHVVCKACAKKALKKVLKAEGVKV